VPRKVNFVATVQMFQFKPLKWLLTSCGVIPSTASRTIPAPCAPWRTALKPATRVLERGEAVGIFPEGITHDDSATQNREDWRGSHGARIGKSSRGKTRTSNCARRVEPVGQEQIPQRSPGEFGEPIRAADFFVRLFGPPKECIHALSAEIERRIQALILHIPQLEHVRIVDAVKRLYLDRLRVGSRLVSEPILPRAGELHLTQAIAAAVEHVYRTQPERAASFARSSISMKMARAIKTCR